MYDNLSCNRHRHAPGRRVLLMLAALCLSTLAPSHARSSRSPLPHPAGTVRDTLKAGISRYREEQPPYEGWGVSLCWWANVCGAWEESRVDSLVDWLVSPEGLNFRIFRYNIGGGEDPYNRHCTPHHMGRGKGLRAEMEGFKDSTDDRWHWDRDEAQRRIMLKIRDRRPDAIFEAFSNSAPYYMTVSGCCGGHRDAWKDNLRQDCYEEFAHYLVDVCRHYRDKYGIEFRTLDPFNEPMTNYWYADGSQEGCHFDFESQIAFLRVLHPILQASGLKTVISAADETSVKTSVRGFHAYRQAGALPLVGQWNTHTYEATDEARTQLGELCREQGIRLWMSETGAGGKGLDGNLGMAERLIQDIRLMRPAAWVDWQYIEDNNDQWCLVQADFYGGTQAFRKVKNYYVRQHFSRFIPQGYTMLQTDSRQILAAMSPGGDTLVAVCVNRGDHDITLRLDIAGDICRKAKLKRAKAWLTTSALDLAPQGKPFLTSDRNGCPTCTIPSGSIATLVIPMKGGQKQR